MNDLGPKKGFGLVVVVVVVAEALVVLVGVLGVSKCACKVILVQRKMSLHHIVSASSVLSAQL